MIDNQESEITVNFGRTEKGTDICARLRQRITGDKPDRQTKTIKQHQPSEIFNGGINAYIRPIMESKRQQKVARQLQKDLSEIFQREVPHLFNGAFITVTSVKISPDLSVARVYLSFLATKNKEQLLETIQEKSKVLRQLLGDRVRHQLRIVPDVSFFIDDTVEYADKMDKLFQGIDIPPAPAEDEDE
ncbi:MAG TPA: 30S ribosome-binding factor RbfA [Spirosoma sp.]|nr:30S ribosome-binding factor RbfA [Spirosoma sp.]